MSGRTSAMSGSTLVRLSDMATRSDLKTLRADVAANILTTRKQLSEQIVGLRRAVVDYPPPSSALAGLSSELETRVRRVE